MASEERYVFIVEWYDPAASMVRAYNLTYFTKDRAIEMVHQLFLFLDLTCLSSI